MAVSFFRLSESPPFWLCLSFVCVKVRPLSLCLSFVVWKSTILVASFFRCFRWKSAIFGCVFLSLCESPPFWFRLSFVVWKSAILAASFFRKVHLFWFCLSFFPKVRHCFPVSFFRLSESPPIWLCLSFVCVKVRHRGCVFLSESSPHPSCVFLSSYLCCSIHQRRRRYVSVDNNSSSSIAQLTSWIHCIMVQAQAAAIPSIEEE